MAQSRRYVALFATTAMLIATLGALPAHAGQRRPKPGTPTPIIETQVGSAPKMILTGAIPTAPWLLKNLGRQQDLPFDGFVFRFTDAVNFMLGDETWTAEDVALDTLPQIPWGRYERFVQLHVAGMYTYDWFDDAAWERTESNMMLLSEAVAASGASGIFFEPYFKFSADGFVSPWTYDATRMHGRSFAEMQALVRERGAQVMQALQSSAPSVHILARYLVSLSAQSSGGQPMSASDASPLLPSFVEGMLDAANPGVTLIDTVDAGLLDDTREYPDGHELVDVAGQAVVSEEVRDRYAQQVEAGAGVYFDVILGVDPRWGYEFSKEYRRSWLRHSIYNAALSSDEYMWVLSKFADFWTGRHVPRGSDDLITSAYQSAAAGLPLGYDLVKAPGSDRLASGTFVSSPAVSISTDGLTIAAQTTARVEMVEFVVDGMVFREDVEAPFSLSIADLGSGVHRVLARTLTGDGDHTSSNVLELQV